MTEKTKALWVLGLAFVLTALLTILKTFEPGNVSAIWLIYVFCAWNFFAYGFDFDMWPWVFVELEGRGEGKPSHREFYFWFTAAIYVALLATIAWAE